MLRFILALFIFHSLQLKSNPFEQIEGDLKEYTERDSYQFFDSDDTQIKELFSSGEQESVASGKEESDYSLPDSLKISRVISSRLVRGARESIETYSVKEKETLKTIAKTFHTTVSRLKSLNHLKSASLKSGQTLRIPVLRKNNFTTRIVKLRSFLLPVPHARVTSRFGSRKDPFNHFKKNYHTGLDLSANVGTAVIASSGGTVEFVGRDGGYGNTIIIRHKGGYTTKYAHLASTYIQTGETVKMGKVIAAVGRTGTATGS
ncbi:MAG: peptidoglycan DD-metalloendopeptidase family protein, partial [Leptospira sp.]|nr:peptidoglycan DD-metalloendopeptidase family protein [Leptospira sp.]